jgi:hypothetical protein
VKDDQPSFGSKPDHSSRSACATGAVNALDEITKRERLESRSSASVCRRAMARFHTYLFSPVKNPFPPS